jgi:transposase InsO family protein
MKVPRRLPQGKLAPLPVPEGAWQDLMMDFIVGLPPLTRQGSVYDAILVIVDRYTKAARYLPITSKVNAEDLADLFLQEIVFKTGAPRSIVTDQGSLFTSAYWEQFCQGLRVKGRLSTAFYPQTDG